MPHTSSRHDTYKLLEFVKCLNHFSNLQIYLWAQWGLLVELSSDKITIFFGCNGATTVDADAARVRDDLTHHVLCSLVTPQLRPNAVQISSLHHRVGFATDGPLGDVVWPLVRGNRGRQFTVLGVEAAHGAGYPTTWPRIPGRPFLPRRDRLLR